MVTRGMLPESPGVIHWSIGQLVSSPDMLKAIAEGPYKNKALVPASPWLDKKAPTPPEIILSKEKDSVKVSWSHKTTRRCLQVGCLLQIRVSMETRYLRTGSREQI